jgi:hypothetical protein
VSLSVQTNPGRKFNVTEDHDRAGVYPGCESYMEIYSVMVRDPKPRRPTVLKNSRILGILAEVSCVHHSNKVALFPQVDTCLDHLLAESQITDVMAGMLAAAESEEPVDRHLLESHWLPEAGDLA